MNIYRRVVSLLGALGLTMVLACPLAIAAPALQESGDEIEEALRKLETEADSVWEYMTSVYDANHDGEITFAEYARTKEAFERLDVDRSGTLTREDFSRGGAQGGGGRRGAGRRGGGRGREDRSGREGGEGRAGREGRRSARARSPKVGASAPDFDLLVLERYADPADAGEQEAEGGEQKRPAQKPAVDAETKKPDKVKLSSFRGKRAVALVFGSYT
ncbi:MAG TPA: hypothetical protein QF764_14810 [Planctomycetota bacterium]|nr:hypothetical protein [Planctomycetota bacterium]